MFTRTRNAMLAAVLAFVGFVAANTTAIAQPPCSCVIVDGCKVVTFYDEFDNPISSETICPSTGTGDFNCSRELPPNGPINTTFPPVSIKAQGFSPTFGTIATRIDPDRPSSNAIVFSNNQKERYPLTVQFSFYAVTEVAGIRYRSETELVFRNDNVHSFRPFAHEKFCLVKDVVFRPETPGLGKFVLQAGGTCVTLN